MINPSINTQTFLFRIHKNIFKALKSFTNFKFTFKMNKLICLLVLATIVCAANAQGIKTFTLYLASADSNPAIKVSSKLNFTAYLTYFKNIISIHFKACFDKSTGINKVTKLGTSPDGTTPLPALMIQDTDGRVMGVMGASLAMLRLKVPQWTIGG